MSGAIFSCDGGELVVPELVLVPRGDGGHLVVKPPRAVWERSELRRDELTRWSILVAAAGQAMLDTLPQLRGGCINYWEAGNWSLNDAAEPRGPKSVRQVRRVHLHLLGRSRDARHPSWRWGEAPIFPSFERRLEWAAGFEPLSEAELQGIVHRLKAIL